MQLYLSLKLSLSIQVATDIVINNKNKFVYTFCYIKYIEVKFKIFK